MTKTSSQQKLNFFEDPEFWKTFNELYWCNTENPEMDKAAKEILKRLPNMDEEKPLRVLVIGIGIGTLDFPLLARIQKYSKRKIHLVGVERSNFAINVISNLIGRDFEDLPLTNSGIATIINSCNQDNTNACRKINYHLLQLDDLDFEKKSDGQDNILSSFPSLWLTRLKDNIAEEFDLIISSFCLFHLTWWRKVTVESFSLLKEGGLFLHAHMNGDEHFFEGNIPPEIDLDRVVGLGLNINEYDRKIKQLNLQKIFDRFFRNSKAKAFVSQPRFASATSPEGILEMLGYLNSCGIERLDNLEYIINPHPTVRTYLSLLKIKGFSTFRLLEEAMGKKDYKELIDEIESFLKDNNITEDTKDNPIFNVVWSVYQKKDAEKFSRSAIVNKFLNTTENNYIPDYKYEIQESLNASPSAERKLFKSEQLAEFIAQKLITGGLLDPSCIGGEIGFIEQLNNPIKYRAFVNPLYKSKDLNWNNQGAVHFADRLRLFLMKIVHRYSYNSTGGSLLKEIMPSSIKPLVLAYNIDDNILETSILYNTFPKYQLLEFNIKIDDNVINKIRKALSEDFWVDFNKKIPIDQSEETNSFKNNFKKWTFTPPDPTKNSVFISILNKLNDLISHEDKKILNDIILEKLKSIGGIPDNLSKELEGILTPKKSESIMDVMLWLFILQPCKYVLMIPVKYELSNDSTSDNVIIFIYDSKESIHENIFLREEKISHEILKVNALYSQHGMFTAQSLGIKSGSDSLLHQFNKDFEIASYYLNDFQEKYDSYRKDPDKTKDQAPELPTWIFTAMSVAKMFIQARSEKVLEETPYQISEILYNEWSEYSINNFVREVINHQSHSRCLRRINKESKEKPIGLVSFWRKYKKPKISLVSPFELIDAKGLYPILIVVLRNAYEHSLYFAFQKKIFAENSQVPLEICISYSRYEQGEKIQIINTGIHSANKRQTGLHRDIQNFQSLTNWTVENVGLENYHIYSKNNGDETWTTTIIR
jgi:hypothetical protein